MTQATDPSIQTFDPDRAWLRETDHFKPFRVSATEPLQRVLADEKVKPDASVLVMQHPAGTIVFLTTQMAYHHIAQGQIAGEPYLVTF